MSGISGRLLRTRSAFWCAVVFGMAIGIAWSVEPSELSAWRDYESIPLGMERELVFARLASSDVFHSGCGAYHFESRDSVCRFEDPWRAYVIGFDPTTKRVNRRYFYFKRLPPLLPIHQDRRGP
jgi:hypothetical protein